MARDSIADFRVMNINFYPRESHLVTFRDPWSFPVLFHPSCNQLIRRHLQDLAQKVSKCFVLILNYYSISLLNNHCRLFRSVPLWANILSSGTTGPDLRLMRREYYALTWHASFRRN